MDPRESQPTSAPALGPIRNVQYLQFCLVLSWSTSVDSRTRLLKRPPKPKLRYCGTKSTARKGTSTASQRPSSGRPVDTRGVRIYLAAPLTGYRTQCFLQPRHLSRMSAAPPCPVRESRGVDEGQRAEGQLDRTCCYCNNTPGRPARPGLGLAWPGWTAENSKRAPGVRIAVSTVVWLSGCLPDARSRLPVITRVAGSWPGLSRVYPGSIPGLSWVHLNLYSYSYSYHCRVRYRTDGTGTPSSITTYSYVQPVTEVTGIW